MRANFILAMLLLVSVLSVFAQQPDTLKIYQLDSVSVTAPSFKEKSRLRSALPTEVVEREFLQTHFTGNLMQTLQHIPGVKSMDIGSGFSKPMIRGMGFNRISVTENGIKQEGQQWGNDHGLEIDAFNIERVNIRKGPSSLLYGSDALGGVIEISQLVPPRDNQLFGELSLLSKSVNGTLGASLLAGMKKDAWYIKLRYSEQQFGDYHIPTDTIVYLTQRIPVYSRKLKNTAGVERNINFFADFRNGRYHANYAVSNAFQKVGFFPGAHGIPDASRVEDDGDSRNIELPYSRVNHFKLTTRQEYFWEKWLASWDVGYQRNHREEWSRFHTHYGTQAPPAHQPDKELVFTLETYSSSMKLRSLHSTVWEYNAGWDVQYQANRIGGYGFLLPRYNRMTTGLFATADRKLSSSLTLSGGIRYDFGKLDISESHDPYLEAYLAGMRYTSELVEQYRWRSYEVARRFGDFSGSLGIVWKLNRHLLKINMGHSFRLPSANELAANGVHHGTFRHEQGDSNLDSEKGWQLDVSYLYEYGAIAFSLSPYVSWFNNYIYLTPTGEWSVLPHAGQIYRYRGDKAFFSGAEVSFNAAIGWGINYAFNGDYVYTYNIDERTPLSFSPPASMRNTLAWNGKKLNLHAELHSIASQHRVAKNEDATPGAHLIHLGGSIELSIARTHINLGFSVNNLLNTKYFNHLSFYRKVEIPEPGRNFQLFIKIPFKTTLK